MRIERIHDGAILGLSAVGIVGALALVAFGASCLQKELDQKPAMIPSAQKYAQPFERTPAEQAKVNAREAINKQAREQEIVPFVVD